MRQPASRLGPGSVRGLRRANRERLLAALDPGTARSQAELARLTGLSAGAISGLVSELVGEGLLVVRVGVTNGRRSNLVERVPRGPRWGVGIDLGRTHVRVVVGDDLGQVHDEACEELPERQPPEEIIRLVASLVTEACARAGLSPGQLDGVGVGLPGPVDTSSGTIAGGSILPAWGGLPLREMLSRGLGRHAVVENDANLGAVALDRMLGSDEGLVFIKIGSGIGAGVVVGGRLLRGRSGMVGEIGHLTLDPRLAVSCRCGRRGCLETLSSTEAIRAALQSALDRDLSLADVLHLVAQADQVALSALDEAGSAVGRALGWLAMLINPARIVVGGPLAEAGEALLAPVRRGFRQAVLPAAAVGVEIVTSPLGQRTEAVGALLVGLEPARVGHADVFTS